MGRISSIVVLILLIILSLLISCSAKGNPGENTDTSIYYVSPYGDDDNPGTRERPWRNPSNVVNRLSPGDTLIFLEGAYLIRDEEDIIIPPSGSPGATITLKADDGAKVIIYGCNNVRTAFDISGKNNLWIEGFEITHAPEGSCTSVLFRDGIEALMNPVKDIVMKRVNIHHIDEIGLNMADVENLTVSESTFTHCGFGGIGGPAGNHGGWKNVFIFRCYMGYSGWYYQNGNEEGNPYDRPDGFGIEPSDGPIEISDCLVEHNRGDGIDSKARKTYIHHCIVRNNKCDGVKVWGSGSVIENTLIYGKGDGDTTPVPWGSIVIDQIETEGATFVIKNVTVHDPVVGSYPAYFGYDSNNPNFSVLMRNTIIMGSRSPVFFGKKVNLSMDHTLIYIPDSDVQVEYRGTGYTSGMIESGEIGMGNLSRDPKFMNPVQSGDGDYHLIADSPAVDSGSSDGAPKDDLDHVERPRGDGFDMGAYER